MKRLTPEDLEQLFLMSQDMLSIIRADGTFKRVNPAWSHILGWSVDEMTDAPYLSFVHPDDHDRTQAEAARLAQGALTIDFENRYRTRTGDYKWVSWRVTPNAPGDLLYCVTRDVTETRRVRDELARQADALEAARAEAVRANLAKSDFLSRMSHELRTPLNAILGFAQLFDRDRMTPEEKDNIRHILEGGRHLLDLINEVIDISRVESGTLALSNEAVEVEEAIRGAIGIVQPLAAQQGIEIAFHAAPENDLAVLADRQRLRQVLLNLLSNAIKYNRPRGSIAVSVQRTASARVQISVADTGPGIPPQLLSRLFQPFERLGAERTSVEGTGLGLALSRALCEAMGGRLAVHSIVDKGSTFTVDLAQTELVTTEHKPAAATEAALGESEGCGKIVYIEDNLANVKLMQRIVARRAGLCMLHASDGRSGLELVRREQPALVLLDLQLPEMSGEAVLGELWRDPVTRSIPIVVLTADATRGLPQRLMSSGARGCLTKPLDVQQVLRIIDSLITEEEAANG